MSDSIDSEEKVDESVWSYRGYQLKPGEFNTAMVHLYRAEITRANVWRRRLDTTTNWAVVTTAAVLSFALGEASAHHSVIILNTLLVTLFLYIEARRYRYYELWSLRVRLLEVNFFGAMLIPGRQAKPDWAQQLSNSLLYPVFPISLWEALGRRLRRNYIWLYLLLAVLWVLKISLFPEQTTSWEELLDRAAIGAVPGWIVLAIGLVVNGIIFTIGLATRHLTDASGEVLPHYANLRERHNIPE